MKKTVKYIEVYLFVYNSINYETKVYTEQIINSLFLNLFSLTRILFFEFNFESINDYALILDKTVFSVAVITFEIRI